MVQKNFATLDIKTSYIELYYSRSNCLWLSYNTAVLLNFRKHFLQSATSSKKTLWHRSFSVNFGKFLKTALAQSGFQQLLLIPHDPFTRRCVKSVQMWSYFWSVFSCVRTKYRDLQISVFSPNAGNYGPINIVICALKVCYIWKKTPSLWDN